MAEKRTTYKLQDVGGIGEVKIADEVVTVIAGLAATEVEGVASMEGNITNELVSKLGVFPRVLRSLYWKVWLPWILL